MSEKGPAGRERRCLRRIVVAVALCLIALIGLASWVLLVPVEVDHPDWSDGGRSVDCSSTDSVDLSGLRADVEALCHDAEEDRRNTALIAGGVVAAVAFAVSTWPSRRLTGEELGPIR
jgi:hypothetical protein